MFSGPGMKGLAAFSKPSDDPYMENKDDSEDERERDAMRIRPNDNLAVAAKFDGDDTTLLVYVYNAETGDFYVHHDYPINAPVLCLEPVRIMQDCNNLHRTFRLGTILELIQRKEIYWLSPQWNNKFRFGTLT